MANLVSDLINEAFLDLNAIAPGETITSAEQTDAFMRLNQLLASWSTEQLSVFNVYHQTFNLGAGQSTYTVGVGGSLVSTANPVRITGAQGVSGGFRSPCEVISFDEFAAKVKDAQSTSAVLPSILAADNAYPYINIKVWPIPGNGGQLALDYWAAITAFGAVSDAVSLPPGYEAALHYNLALMLYPQYGRAGGIDPVLAAMAKSTKESIVAKNAAILGMVPTPQNAAPQQ